MFIVSYLSNSLRVHDQVIEPNVIKPKHLTVQ